MDPYVVEMENRKPILREWLRLCAFGKELEIRSMSNIIDNFEDRLAIPVVDFVGLVSYVLHVQ